MVELHGFEVVIFSVSWLIEALASGVGNHTRVLPMFGEKKEKRSKSTAISSIYSIIVGFWLPKLPPFLLSFFFRKGKEGSVFGRSHD